MRSLVLLVLLSASTAFGASDPAGKVAKVTGIVQALRNPAKTAKPAKAGAPAQAKYAGQYWDAVDLREGAEVHFGDVLSASPQGKTQIQLDSGFNVILAPSAKLRLSRAIAGRLSEGPVVDLLSGAMRARSREGADESGTTFKTRSIVMGVRGTDFSVVTFPRETQVVVVEGEIAVRNLLAPESAASAEVILTKGQATSILNPPEDQDYEALRRTLPPAEYEKAVAAFDPKPAEPATADQARRIRDFSEGITSETEKREIETLVEERTAAETKAPPPEKPAPAPEPKDERKWLGFEVSLGVRSVATDGVPEIDAEGFEIRVLADVAPFSFPLAFGFGFSDVQFKDSGKFDDRSFKVKRAREQSFMPHLRYTHDFNETHSVYTRLGLRPAELELEGENPADKRSHTIVYDAGGLWLGVGYAYAVAWGFKAVVSADLYPGSLENKGNFPPDQDLTKDPDGHAWGGNAFSIGARYEM